MLLCAVAAVTLFTSCGSDSDDDGIEGSLSSMLTQYAWKTNAYYDTMEWDEY